MRVLVQAWRERYGATCARCIYAGSADKALGEVLELLSPIVGEWLLPPVNSPRILPPAELEPIVRAASAAPITQVPTLAKLMQGLSGTAEHPTLICGSFFLLGEAKACLEQDSSYRRTAQ